jgi:hypothetical protein
MVEKGRLEVEGGADVRAPSVGNWERGEAKLGWQAELGCGEAGTREETADWAERRRGKEE